jgi:hypothetical protein
MSSPEHEHARLIFTFDASARNSTHQTPTTTSSLAFPPTHQSPSSFSLARRSTSSSTWRLRSHLTQHHPFLLPLFVFNTDQHRLFVFGGPISHHAEFRGRCHPPSQSLTVYACTLSPLLDARSQLRVLPPSSTQQHSSSGPANLTSQRTTFDEVFRSSTKHNRTATFLQLHSHARLQPWLNPSSRARTFSAALAALATPASTVTQSHRTIPDQSKSFHVTHSRGVHADTGVSASSRTMLQARKRTPPA